MSDKHDPKPITGEDPGGILQPRPSANARWVCGYQASGMACVEGPSQDGKCCQLTQSLKCDGASDCAGNCASVAQCELAALRRRPVLPSHEGLGPCVPRRAAWFSRETIALNAAILTGGILLLCMALPSREKVFVPGNLSSKHSQILGNRLVKDRCSLCHASQHSEMVGLSQDDLCMKCHESHMPDAAGRSPHDLTDFQLVSLQTQPDNQSDVKQSHDTTTCASCHVEHHGNERDLTEISDSRCQACHAKQFKSLSLGHPEFSNFPYVGRRNMAFSHRSHAGKHFAQKGQAFDCRSCHLPVDGTSSTSTLARTLGYEAACASCHDDSLRSKAVGGWAVISIPSILEADIQSGVSELTNWPAGARYGYDGTVPLAMQVLLASDEQVRGVFASLPESGELAKIRDKSRQAEVALAVASATRRLIADLASDGQAAWRRRLKAVAEAELGRTLESREQLLIDQLAAGLPPNLFRQIQETWFGDAGRLARAERRTTGRLASASEVATDLLATQDNASSNDDDLLLFGDDQSGDVLDAIDAEAGSERNLKEPTQLTKLEGISHVNSGGWYLDDDLYTIRYMPTGHADNTIAAWTEFAQLLGGTSASSLGKALHASSGADSIMASCTECHLLKTSGSGQLAEWKAIQRPSSVRPFTKFNHQPHLTLPAVNDCRYCHVINEPPGQEQESSATISADEVETNWPKRFTSGAVEQSSPGDSSHAPLAVADWHGDFIPMQLSQCVACHRDGAARDSCTTCHYYHVGTPGFEWTQSQEPEVSLREMLGE